MKMNYALAKAVMTGVIGGLMFVAGAAGADDIERSCNGDYRLLVDKVNNAQGDWLYSISDDIGTGLENRFTARRGCGRTVPNRCRQRANEALMQCMQAHAKNPTLAPEECRSNGVRGYPVSNLEKLAKEKACTYVLKSSKINPGYLPRGYTVSLNIKGKVSGDEGCGGGNQRETVAELLSLTVKCTPD